LLLLAGLFGLLPGVGADPGVALSGLQAKPARHQEIRHLAPAAHSSHPLQKVTKNQSILKAPRNPNRITTSTVTAKHRKTKWPLNSLN
jgi:hypothetical protein